MTFQSSFVRYFVDTLEPYKADDNCWMFKIWIIFKEKTYHSEVHMAPGTTMNSYYTYLERFRTPNTFYNSANLATNFPIGLIEISQIKLSQLLAKTQDKAIEHSKQPA